MSFGTACTIFTNIHSDKWSDEEKYEAIRRVLDMPTYNSVTKAQILEVMLWVLAHPEQSDEEEQK